MKLLHVLLYAGVCYLAEDGNFENPDPWYNERPKLEQVVEVSGTSSSFIQQGPSSDEENVTITTRRPKIKKKAKRGKKKKLRQVKVHPRGGRHIKDTYQNLQSVQYVTDDKTTSRATTETVVVTLEPIYDKTENTFSQEELLKLCEETKSIGQKFGINNVSSFAGSNCALIRLYYPDVTCEQINVFLQYCQASGSI